jgi:O-antigen/teichoic acid export membrane protein
MTESSSTAVNGIIKDSIVYMPSHVIPAICGVISISVFTRLLTPEQYAFYTLVFATVTLVGNIVFGWFTFSGQRFYDETKDEPDKFFSTTYISFFLILAGTVIIGFFCFSAYKTFFDNSLGYNIFIISAGLLGAKTLFDLILVYLRASRQAYCHSIYKGSDAVIKMLLAIALIIYLHQDYKALIYSMIISFSGISIFEILRSQIYKKIRLSSYSNDFFKKMFRYGFPLIGVGITGTLLSIADRYLLALFCDYKTVGVYSAGYRFAEMINDMPGAIFAMAYAPIIIQQFNNSGDEGVKETLSQSLKIVFLFLMPVAFGSILLSKDIVHLFLGKQYVEVNSIFLWVCSGVFLCSLTQVFTRVFELKQVTRFVLIISGTAMILNILLNIILIPRLGYIGSAMATFMAYLCQFVMSVYFSRSLIKFSIPYLSIIKIFIASGIMYAVLFLIFRSFAEISWMLLFIKVTLGVILYFGVLLLSNESALKNVFTAIGSMKK